MTEIQIRATEPGDADALYEIFSGPRAVAGTLQMPWVSVEARRAWVQHDPNVHSLVASIEGRVVAQAGLHLQTRGRRRDCADIGMAVHDDFQGRGVGSALMAALMSLADNWYGLRRVELTVWADNAAAVHLYQKFGFAIEGTARQYALRDGELVDALYMARLRPNSSST